MIQSPCLSGTAVTQSLLVPVDTGNKQIKTPRHIFTAGLACHDSYPPFGKDVIQYKGKYYTLSDQRVPYMRDKTADERYFILRLFGIACELRDAGLDTEERVNVDLLLGLPPAHFGTQEERYRSYFHEYGQIDFRFNDQPVSLFISEVRVYPQAYAAIAPMISQLQGYSKALVVDIGGYTADILKISSGMLDLSVCDSLEYGTINFYNLAMKRINSTFDLLLDENDIDTVLRGGNSLLEEPVAMQITKMAREFVEDFFNRLREQGIDLKTYYTVFVGGGSILFRPLIESSDKLGRCTFVEEIKSNAIGYQRLYQLGL